MIVIIYRSRKKSRQESEVKNMTITANKMADFEKAYQAQRLPEINTGMTLKKGESAYLNEDVKLFELRTARKSTRGGGGMRVAKGVFIGGTTGTSRGFDELKEIDTGSMLLTNQRLIFSGKNNTRDIKLEKIIDIKEYTDGITISAEGKSKNQTYTGMANPYLWKALINVLQKLPPDGSMPEINISEQ